MVSFVERVRCRLRVWLSVPWLALAGAQLAVAIGAGSLHMEESRWLILRAVLLFGHVPHFDLA